MATNAEIINLALGNTYKSRIPTATQENLSEVANAILAYEPAKNEFLTNLFNKIGLTLISKIDFNNPFARYRGARIEYGDTVEDIYVDLQVGYEYDQTNTDPFGQSKPNVQALYHTINFEMQYKTTINDSLIRRAIRTPNGLTDLVTSCVAALRDSADYDEYICTIKLLSNDSIYGKIVYLGEATGNKKTDSTNLLTAIKNVGSSMRFMSKEFNQMKTNQVCSFDRQLLIIDYKYKDSIDLDVLAGVYNLSKADIAQRIIEVEGFIENTGLACVVVDERGFKLNQALVDGGMIYNPQGLYTNHFYNNWEVISWSLYRNAVAIKFVADPTGV